MVSQILCYLFFVTKTFLPPPSYFVPYMSELKDHKTIRAEVGQAQPQLGFGENDLSLRGYILRWFEWLGD